MIEPIETRYAGHRFRSRLEARWAVFFETLQLAWRYEPAGFALPSGPYLPDFFLTINPSARGDLPEGSGYWVEIKPPGEPKESELVSLRELAEETGHNAFLVAGRPWSGKFDTWKALRDGRVLAGHGAGNHLGGMPGEWELCDRDYDMGFGVDFMDAFRRASDARFEHGEKPGLTLGWESVEPVT